jgi:hypothetical protein
MKSPYTLVFLIFCFACSNTKTNEVVSNPTGEVETEEGNFSRSDSSEAAFPAGEEPAIETKQDSSARVYVTEVGDKYHTADCRYSKTAQAIALKEAKAKGKTACDICKPNSKTGSKQNRCSGKTEEGKRCQRMTGDPSGKCFQHRDG